MTKSSIEIRNIEDASISDVIQDMTGWSPYELWRCDSEDAGVRCREMATLELGNPSKVQVCERCSGKPLYKRFRVREPMHHSDALKREFQECRRRHLSIVGGAHG